jgi:hypothetical protein
MTQRRLMDPFRCDRGPATRPVACAIGREVRRVAGPSRYESKKQHRTRPKELHLHDPDYHACHSGTASPTPDDRRIRRVQGAGFPRPKFLDDFDDDANPNLNAATVNTLANGEWVRRGDSLLPHRAAPARATCSSGSALPPREKATASKTHSLHDW